MFAKDLKIADSKWIVFFIVIWLFSYIQKQNINWGFQSQFFLAYLLPLISLYYLQKSFLDKKVIGSYFLLSCLFSVFSVFTMANGMLILILNFFYAVFLKFTKKRIIVLFSLLLIFCSLYLLTYSSPIGSHSTFFNSIKSNPVGMLEYSLQYLGGPFYRFFGKGDFGEFIAISFGLFLIASSIYFTINAFLSNRNNKYLIIALSFFIFYVVGAAILTSGGRVVFSPYHAFTSRYTTPGLMAWLALFLIYFQFVKFSYPVFKAKLQVMFIILVVLMIPRQLKVFTSTSDELFEKKVAALALELRINDLEQFKHVYHSPERLLNLTKDSFDQNLSFFGYAPYKDLFEVSLEPFSIKPKFNPS